MSVRSLVPHAFLWLCYGLFMVLWMESIPCSLPGQSLVTPNTSPKHLQCQFAELLQVLIPPCFCLDMKWSQCKSLPKCTHKKILKLKQKSSTFFFFPLKESWNDNQIYNLLRCFKIIWLSGIFPFMCFYTFHFAILCVGWCIDYIWIWPIELLHHVQWPSTET